MDDATTTRTPNPRTVRSALPAVIQPDPNQRGSLAPAVRESRPRLTAVNLLLDRLNGIPGQRRRLRPLPERMPRELSGH